jgi:hypothetical protein
MSEIVNYGRGADLEKMRRKARWIGFLSALVPVVIPSLFGLIFRHFPTPAHTVVVRAVFLSALDALPSGFALALCTTTVVGMRRENVGWLPRVAIWTGLIINGISFSLLTILCLWLGVSIL